MKKTIILLFTALAIVGCAPANKGADINPKKDTDLASNVVKVDTYNDQFDQFQYSKLYNFLPAYNERDLLIGYIFTGQSMECGSDCQVHTFFISGQGENLKVKRIPELDGNLETSFFEFEKDTNIYKADFIWAEGESHFGCHKFTFKKIKFINGKFTILDEVASKNKYAIDLGDSQGQCTVFSSAQDVMRLERIFK